MLRDALIEWMSISTVFEPVTKYGSEALSRLRTNSDQIYVGAREGDGHWRSDARVPHGPGAGSVGADATSTGADLGGSR